MSRNVLFSFTWLHIRKKGGGNPNEWQEFSGIPLFGCVCLLEWFDSLPLSNWLSDCESVSLFHS